MVAKKPKRKKSCKKNSPKFKSIQEHVFYLKVEDPTRSNVEIAKKCKCDESYVRRLISGKLKDQIYEALKLKFIDDLFVMRIKALRKMDEMLDDPAVFPSTKASICKFLLKALNDSTDEGDKDEETIAFETIIPPETGNPQRIQKSLPTGPEARKKTDSQVLEAGDFTVEIPGDGSDGFDNSL